MKLLRTTDIVHMGRLQQRLGGREERLAAEIVAVAFDELGLVRLEELIRALLRELVEHPEQ